MYTGKKRMNHKEIFLFVTLLFMLFGIKSFANELSDNKIAEGKPNIILIVVDDLGISDLNCYGADLHESPNIDKLAQQGVMFTNAYASASICTPTRASIMTGKYPARLNMTIWREWAKNPQFDQKLIPPDTEENLPAIDITIAERLKDEDYVTAHIGKWHLGDASNYPEMHGYDINIAASHWGCPPTFFYPYRGNIYDSERYVPGLELSTNGNYFEQREGEYLTDRLTDEAIKILEEAKGKPLFMSLNYYSVHTPIEAKQDVVDYFNKKMKPEMHHQNPIYAAMVHSMDENIGRLITKIDELGISENTVVIFTSDNGGFINEWDKKTVTNNYPFRSGKGSLYEGGVRVPLIVRYPGITKVGSVCAQPTSSIDLYPTIIAATGNKNPVQNQEIDGINIFPLFDNPESKLKREYLFWHYPHYYNTTTPVSSVRKGKWKLLEYFEDHHLELYNLEDDPGEKNDLSKDLPKKAKELHKALNNWRINVNAQIPTENQNINK